MVVSSSAKQSKGLSKALQELIARTRPGPPTAGIPATSTTKSKTADELHSFRLRLVYRKLIKLHKNWSIDRDHFASMVQYNRELFERYNIERNTAEANSELTFVERWTSEYRHPDPYTPPQQRGGPVYQRNVPPPYSILEREWEEIYRVPKGPAPPKAGADKEWVLPIREE